MELLEANWLRAASRSIRARHPALYARLNGVRNRILSRGTDLAGYQAKALRRFQSYALRLPHGKRVLEIGSDREGRVLRWLAQRGVAQAVGVNPTPEIWAETSRSEISLCDRAVLRNADARELPFGDGAFDLIF